MFVKESNDKFIDRVWVDDQSYMTSSTPSESKFIDATLIPHSYVGSKSGAFVLASYYEAFNFKFNNPDRLTDAYIIENIYDKVQTKGAYNHIALSDGMNVLCDKLNQSSSYCKYNVYYTLYSQFLKQFLHKNSFAIVELNANSAYCSMNVTDFNGKYKIEQNGNMLSDILSKAFLCVGYDDYGVILMNSLGTSFGSSGFIKVKWDIIHSNFIKAAIISNL